uniref:Arrestin_N domain-containing protein n=1 Tax=Caenorhabditis tropicalis TaxID=1561998 RepID=A0A1I7UKW8_9PELO
MSLQTGVIISSNYIATATGFVTYTPKTNFHLEHCAPLARTEIRDGALLIEGRIKSVGIFQEDRVFGTGFLKNVHEGFGMSNLPTNAFMDKTVLLEYNPERNRFEINKILDEATEAKPLVGFAYRTRERTIRIFVPGYPEDFSIQKTEFTSHILKKWLRFTISTKTAKLDPSTIQICENDLLDTYQGLIKMPCTWRNRSLETLYGDTVHGTTDQRIPGEIWVKVEGWDPKKPILVAEEPGKSSRSMALQNRNLQHRTSHELAVRDYGGHHDHRPMASQDHYSPDGGYRTQEYREYGSYQNHGGQVDNEMGRLRNPRLMDSQSRNPQSLDHRLPNEPDVRDYGRTHNSEPEGNRTVHQNLRYRTPNDGSAVMDYSSRQDHRPMGPRDRNSQNHGYRAPEPTYQDYALGWFPGAPEHLQKSKDKQSWFESV